MNNVKKMPDSEAAAIGALNVKNNELTDREKRNLQRRINRALKGDHLKLHKLRHGNRMYNELGPYYIRDHSTNSIIVHGIADLTAFAIRIQLLRPNGETPRTVVCDGFIWYCGRWPGLSGTALMKELRKFARKFN